MQLHERMRWLFWEVDFDGLDTTAHAIRTFGMRRIHAFLRDEGHPEIGPRTLAFWRAAFRAEKETWASPPDFRTSGAAHWPR